MGNVERMAREWEAVMAEWVCMAVSPYLTLYCTEKPGHTGDHVAQGAEHNELERWDNVPESEARALDGDR